MKKPIRPKKNTFSIKKLRSDYIGKNRQHVDRKTVDFTKIIVSKFSNKPYMLCETPISSIDHSRHYNLVKDENGFLYIVDKVLLNKVFNITDLEEITRKEIVNELEEEQKKLESLSDEKSESSN